MGELEHTLKQLEKLLEGKVFLILGIEDMEELVLAAVPALHMEAEELTWEKTFLSMEDLRRLDRLHRLEKELDLIPRPLKASIISFPNELKGGN